MRIQAGVLTAAGLLLAGCNYMTVGETVLSTNQKLVMVSTPGDSVAPPANLVLIQSRPGGPFVPVSTGFGQAPVPAFLNGAGAGIAVGAGLYGAAKVAKPATTNVTSNNSNAQAQSQDQQQQQQQQQQQSIAPAL